MGSELDLVAQIISVITINSIEFITHCIALVRISQHMVHAGWDMGSVVVGGDGKGKSCVLFVDVVFTTSGHGMLVNQWWIWIRVWWCWRWDYISS